MSVRPARMLRGALVTAIVAVSVTSCSGSSAVPQSELEKDVAEFANERFHQENDATCDGDLDADKDATQDCTWTNDDGQEIKLTVTATKIDGENVEYSITPSDSSGERLSGTGYTIEAPDGWRDATQLAGGTTGIKVDLAMSADPTGGVSTNINVIRRPASGMPDLASAAQIVASQASGGGASEKLPDIKIDGEPASGRGYETKAPNGKTIAQQVYVVKRQDSVYLITLTTAVGEMDGSVLTDALQTWTWE